MSHNIISVDFIIECGCEWEKEHGLEIVVIQSQVVHIGQYEGNIEY